MPVTADQPAATIQFLDADGIVRGGMELYGTEGTIEALDVEAREVSFTEFRDRGDVTVSLERVQLLEGRRYDYVLETRDGFTLDHASHPCLVPHRADDSKGHLEPGTYTGLLQLRLNGLSGETAIPCVEVQSAKAGSLRHYVTMVEDIADRCTELLMQITSPAQARFESFGEQDAETLTQRFFFLEALLGKQSFQDAIERIVRNPHVRSTGAPVEKSLSRGGFSIRAGELRQIACRHPRRQLPEEHPLYGRVPGLTSVPETVVTREYTDFTDTPENRFIRHALRTFLFALEEIAAALRTGGADGAAKHVAQRADALAAMLGEHLSHSFFRKLSEPAFLPLGSPVLQRREGYREVLRAWLNFELAAQLVWTGGDEVFGAGKRDIAKLYEFWLYFKLEDVVATVFNMQGRPSGPDGDLIRETDDGLGLTLASGKRLDWRGSYAVDGAARLNVRFSFNRTFAGQGQGADVSSTHGGRVNYGQGRPGAWTSCMRPDYTVSLWPPELAEGAAERAEQIVHLHFDAKYRVQNVSGSRGSVSRVLDLFTDVGPSPAAAAPQNQDEEIAVSAGLGEESEEAVAEQEEAEKEGRVSKRADLLKMHAYRDAIRRSEGAYVLYPGTAERRWAEYHELLPGIGAFPVCPGSTNDMANVGDFLRRAADLCVDRFSQLHRQRHWTGEVMREAPGGYRADAPAPPAVAPAKIPPPADTTVLLGYMRKTAQAVCRQERLFYFHAVYPEGTPARRFDPRVLGARILTPYNEDGLLGWCAEIKGTALVLREELEQLLGPGVLEQSAEHPERDPSHYYLVQLASIHDGLPALVPRWSELLPLGASPMGGPPVATTWAALFADDGY